MKNRKENSPVEIYIHIPFCIRKCDYCDFLSGPSGPKEQADYVQALLREIQAVEEGEGRSVSSIFIGGGTPSVLDERLLGDILKEIRNRFKVEEDAEITIEVNPGTANIGKLQAYREMGINRLSIGLQSPQDRELKILGRIHNYGQFLEIYQEARTVGFDNINIDLMSAIPDQTYEGWVKNLRTAAELEPEHISAYSLIVEEGTPFAARKLNLPDEDTEYNMYEATAQILKEYGLEQYEISNYARGGKACIHNIGYWTGIPYLGLGLGAASLMNGCRFTNTTSLERYRDASRKTDFPDNIRKDLIRLSRQEQMEEFMFLGLRLRAGISKTEFAQRFGIPIEEIYGDVIRRYKELALLQEENGRIFLSRHGIHVSNTVMSDFLL